MASRRFAFLACLLLFLLLPSSAKAGPAERAIPAVLRDESGLAADAPVQANVVLIHGILSGRDCWTSWLRYAGERKNFPYRVWTFSYNWDNIANTCAHKLADEMLKPENRVKFAGRKIVLVGHSKGGLVAKAFAWRLLAKDRSFPRADALGFDTSDMRIVYLDAPNHGGGYVGNFFVRLVIAQVTALIAGDLFPNLGSAEELSYGYPHDPGVAIASYTIVPARPLKNDELEVYLKLLGLEHLFGADKPLHSAIVPYYSSIRTRSQGTFVLGLDDLDGANQVLRGAVPTARYVYYDWHGAVARSRRAFDLVFDRIIPSKVTALSTARPRGMPTRAVVARCYRSVLGRAPTPQELSDPNERSVDSLREDLKSSVEFEARGIPNGEAFTAAWQRHGGERALGRPNARALEVPPRSGRWILWMNPPDSSLVVMFKTPRGSAYVVRGPIALYYFAAPDCVDRYGFPTGDETKVGDEVRQGFEKGQLRYRAGSVSFTAQ